MKKLVNGQLLDMTAEEISAKQAEEEQALKTMLHELGHHVHYYSYKADISATNTRMNIYGTLNKEHKKASGKQKLIDLGLSDDEIKALMGA